MNHIYRKRRRCARRKFDDNFYNFARQVSIDVDKYGRHSVSCDSESMRDFCASSGYHTDLGLGMMKFFIYGANDDAVKVNCVGSIHYDTVHV